MHVDVDVKETLVRARDLQGAVLDRPDLMEPGVLTQQQVRNEL